MNRAQNMTYVKRLTNSEIRAAPRRLHCGLVQTVYRIYSRRRKKIETGERRGSRHYDAARQWYFTSAKHSRFSSIHSSHYNISVYFQFSLFQCSFMIVYNYDADLEVSDTCVRNSLLSWVSQKLYFYFQLYFSIIRPHCIAGCEQM